MAFEIELGFEGVVDRFDDLMARSEEPSSGSGCLCFGGWSDQGHSGLVEGLLEAGPPISLVRDKGLAWASQAAVGDHAQGGVAFVCCGRCQRVGDGQSRWCGHKMETQTPKVSGMGGVVAVFGPIRKVRAAGGETAAAAFDRYRPPAR